MKRALKWLWDNADTIGIGCMWFVAAIDLVILRKLDDACVWAMFATVCMVQTRHRAELDRLRIEAQRTRGATGSMFEPKAARRPCENDGVWTKPISRVVV
jgi:hypothetical protein